ncbi:hypothetical protein RF11_00465 [Thelohanellus kitauei]|uniref:Uncharacterized protein n=1 Tax=Thelohanellus kitauei TaxID=669202 RepID=A0A0C2MSC9_THEKT|nr:hypothetical protein RF11_00465 [Thelohanellus kitauei]
MASNTMIEDFVLNIQLIESSDKEKWAKGTEWMQKFEESVKTEINCPTKKEAKICGIVAFLYNRIFFLDWHLPQILTDIRLIDVHCSECNSNFAGDQFLLKKAMLFLKELFCDLQSYQGPDGDSLKSEIFQGMEYVDFLIVNFH